MKCEKGFILPTTMVVVLFCLLVVAYVASSHMNEKKFYFETEQHYILENLVLLATTYSIQRLTLLDEETLIDQSETIETSNGRFSFKVNKVTSDTVDLSLYCMTKTNRTKKVAFQYSLSQKTINLWSEVN
ncbi:competence type IV pilus minor pilin ComGG [Metabacillus sp. HB246100]